MEKKKDFKIYIPITIIVAIVISIAVYWYIDYIKYIKTDDAYLTSDVVTVSPKLMGRISKLYVEEGDSVKAGQLLAELDSIDLIAQQQQLISSQMQTETGKLQAQAKFEFDKKNIEVQKIALEKSTEDYNRSKTQFNGGVLTKEQFDHQKKSMETANAQYEAAKAQLNLSKTQIIASEAAIKTANAQLNVLKTQIRNTKLYSSTNGVVAKRWLLTGDIVNPGQSVYTVNNNSKFWVNVFLEETKIKELYLGQDVEFTLDTYANETFTGKIFMIGNTTASQFSLIPANNASGNFTKITQRIPVKVSIEKSQSNKNISEYRLLTGMSAVVKIIR